MTLKDLTKEQIKDLSYFLKQYVEEIISKVMEEKKFLNDGILNMMKELRIRGEQEAKDFTDNINNYIKYSDEDEFWKASLKNAHNYCMTHAKSYRDVLHDLLIREKQENKQKDR